MYEFNSTSKIQVDETLLLSDYENIKNWCFDKASISALEILYRKEIAMVLSLNENICLKDKGFKDLMSTDGSLISYENKYYFYLI